MSAVTETAKPACGRTSGEGELYQFPFTSDDFHHIRSLIYRMAGISLAPSKKDLVYSRLARRLRVRQIDSFSEYIQFLESNDQLEREEFINALTTNMTSFFREAHHFPILAKYLGTIQKSNPINIWTCASSSGEEPYSIAMTVVDHFKSFNVPVRILATDIDTNVLEKARRGVYPLDQLQKLPPDMLKRFFLKGSGKNAGFAKVRPELQRLITFGRFNLLDEQWSIREKFDVIFCRNVMIYFDKSTQYEILKKMQPRMQPHGLFFAGHSESFHHAADLFKVCGKTVYSPKV
ncbi:MAG: chemotaxis protein CheR [Desulfuromonadaceae bacterium]|nr:chemotaxis protein CheR [Desulfuromonadaceae bacterium]MDD2847950.1 chemotaxis protein CheR [Desulfuromonadaceae bacterium]MDD4131308.1 chemotaxis protein CheR [Desulfuromonadaceae bacterium]